MRITSILLIVLLANIASPSRVIAGDKQDKETRFAQKVKNELLDLGTGSDARVEVTLRDKTKLKGHITEISNEAFVIVDDKTGTTTTIAYSQVKQVKGNNLSSGAKIAIGVGIAVGVLVIIGLTAGRYLAQ